MGYFYAGCVGWVLGVAFVAWIRFDTRPKSTEEPLRSRTRYWVDGLEYCKDCAQRRVDFLEENLNWHPEIRVVREPVEV